MRAWHTPSPASTPTTVKRTFSSTSRRRHTRFDCDWSSDVCSSDLLSQSTNDVYPTAIKLALQFGIKRLAAEMRGLRSSFHQKSIEFESVLKVGRTQLQDAVPMTLGLEFSTYAVMLDEDEHRLAEAGDLIREINLGATAIGTGINVHPDYATLVTERLSELSGVRFIMSPNLIEATQDAGAFVQLSGVLKRIAVKLSKTCNEIGRASCRERV